MAKKKAVSQKTPSQPAENTVDDAPAEISTKDSPPSTKSKPKTSDDPASDGGVGIGDIKKAVAFSNSVGGLEKAVALLQILKVAKDVQ